MVSPQVRPTHQAIRLSRPNPASTRLVRGHRDPHAATNTTAATHKERHFHHDLLAQGTETRTRHEYGKPGHGAQRTRDQRLNESPRIVRTTRRHVRPHGAEPCLRAASRPDPVARTAIPPKPKKPRSTETARTLRRFRPSEADSKWRPSGGDWTRPNDGASWDFLHRRRVCDVDCRRRRVPRIVTHRQAGALVLR